MSAELPTTPSFIVLIAPAPFSRHSITYGANYVTTKSFAANLEVLLRVLPYSARFSEVPLLYDYGLKKSKSKMNVFKTLREYQGLILKRVAGKL